MLRARRVREPVVELGSGDIIVAAWMHGLNRLLRRLDVQIVSASDLWRCTARLGDQPEPHGVSPVHPDGPFLTVHDGWHGPPRQRWFDFAVIMPTTARPSIADALRSIFRQDFGGSVQTLIGLDQCEVKLDFIEQCCLNIPRNHSVFVFYPGYSTSVRHGGLHPSWDGGAMRTVLCYLANSRRLAFLDDDNWWDERHLSSMDAALAGHEWAHARRWFVHPRSRQPLCEDTWESVGPDAGIYREDGGWVDPNCLAFDKLACEAVLRWWSIPVRDSISAADADRNVYRILRNEFRGAATGKTTVFYAMNEQDAQHSARIERIGPEHYERCARPYREERRPDVRYAAE
jgi:hypothetical protein